MWVRSTQELIPLFVLQIAAENEERPPNTFQSHKITQFEMHLHKNPLQNVTNRFAPI